MLQRLAKFSTVALAILLTLGGSVAWGVFAGWCLLVGQQAAQSDQVYEYLFVTPEGRPLIQRYSGSNFAARQYRDLDGNPVEHSDRTSMLQGAALVAPIKSGLAAALDIGSPRLVAFNDGGDPAVYWYVVDNGDDALFFEGFDSRSKLRVGYIGLGGYTAEPPPRSERFPIDRRLLGVAGIHAAFSSGYLTREQPEHALGYAGPNRISGWMVYVISGNRLLEVNLRERTVRQVLTAEGMTAVAVVERALPEAAARDEGSIPLLGQNLAVRTDEAILIVSPKDGGSRSFPIPSDVRDAQLTVYELDTDRLLALAPRIAGVGIWDYRLCWLGAEGETRRRDVRMQMGSTQELSAATIISLCIPSPLAATTVGGLVMPASLVESGAEPNFRTALFRSLREWWPLLALLYLLSGALAVLVYRRQRQYAFSAPLLWALFVFAGGPLAYVAYLAHRTWPARKPCPNCDQPAPQDRDRCAECAAPFPSPRRKGIEVFA